MRRRHPGFVAHALGIALLAAGCSRAPTGGTYVPRVREVTLTTVPLMVKETQAVYPFLKKDFARGGVLEGKEVYAFSPSTVTVVQGDTVDFTFVNPEDDLHSFVLPGFAVALPRQSTTHATYVARKAGIYPFTCNIAAHLPMMWGQLVVLAPGAVGGEGR